MVGHRTCSLPPPHSRRITSCRVKGHVPEKKDPAGQGHHATCPGPAGVSVIAAGLARADDRKLRAPR
jgi:hypothetical protein